MHGTMRHEDEASWRAGAEENRRRRDELKREYGEAFEQLNAILFADDPIGIAFGDNTGEYEPEVGTILPRLRGCQSVAHVRGIVHSEFVRWFGADVVGPEERYQTIAERTWREVVPRMQGGSQ